MFPYRRIIMSSAAALSTLLFLLSCSPTPGYLRNKNVRYSSELRDVRVLLARSKDSMSVSSGSRISIREKKSGRLIYDGKGGALKITPEKTADVLVIESWGGYFSLNGSP
jgi:hypothetical protein